MTCPSDWLAYGVALLGIAALLVALPLGFILWLVLQRTVTLSPPEEPHDSDFGTRGF
jgi:hypothetical protein